jgi:hypothetical protein
MYKDGRKGAIISVSESTKSGDSRSNLLLGWDHITDRLKGFLLKAFNHRSDELAPHLKILRTSPLSWFTCFPCSLLLQYRRELKMETNHASRTCSG